MQWFVPCLSWIISFKTFFLFFLSLLVYPQTGEEVWNADNSSESDIEIVFEQQPTKDQAELARKLMLPPTFFIYKNKPGYMSDESDGKSVLHFMFDILFIVIWNGSLLMNVFIW